MTDEYAETERVRRIWERLAPKYDKLIKFPERWLFSGGRDWVCSQAIGDVLEIAVGTGRNLEHYPADVRLTGIDLSESMLAIAKRTAESLGRQADLRVGDAQALEFPAGSFDTVVCTLSLCSVPDDRKAVGEVSRVLRPGGRFLLLEHVASPRRTVRAITESIDTRSGCAKLRELRIRRAAVADVAWRRQIRRSRYLGS